MPCEPVTSGVPPTRGQPSPSSTSSVAFRMKRTVDSGGGGSGARRALTALGTNDTKLNLRLAKSLLTISQDKFAKKWNFDPVHEVPLGQGRFSWTPTLSSSSSSPAVVCALPGLDLTGPSCQLLGGLTSCSSGPRTAASHDLAVTEAEDNAAALRTCLNLPPGGLAPHSDTHRPAALTPTPHTGVPLYQEQPRVPPMHPEEPIPITSSTGPSISPPADAGDAIKGPTAEATAGDTTPNPCPNSRPPIPAVVPSTTSSSCSSSRSSIAPVSPGNASEASGPASSVDSEVVVGAEAPQDNQCQEIDPTTITTQTPPVVTDESRQLPTGAHTQTCITNYLHPRKRSSAHLKEAVHPSKPKKVMLAA